ncbi:hypothetical protein PCE1_004674 [Barthelona sp. PCE]
MSFKVVFEYLSFMPRYKPFEERLPISNHEDDEAELNFVNEGLIIGKRAEGSFVKGNFWLQEGLCTQIPEHIALTSDGLFYTLDYQDSTILIQWFLGSISTGIVAADKVEIVMPSVVEGTILMLTRNVLCMNVRVKDGESDTIEAILYNTSTKVFRNLSGYRVQSHFPYSHATCVLSCLKDINVLYYVNLVSEDIESDTSLMLHALGSKRSRSILPVLNATCICSYIRQRRGLTLEVMDCTTGYTVCASGTLTSEQELRRYHSAFLNSVSEGGLSITLFSTLDALTVAVVDDKCTIFDGLCDFTYIVSGVVHSIDLSRDDFVDRHPSLYAVTPLGVAHLNVRAINKSSIHIHSLNTFRRFSDVFDYRGVFVDLKHGICYRAACHKTDSIFSIFYYEGGKLCVVYRRGFMSGDLLLTKYDETGSIAGHSVLGDENSRYLGLSGTCIIYSLWINQQLSICVGSEELYSSPALSNLSHRFAGPESVLFTLNGRLHCVRFKVVDGVASIVKTIVVENMNSDLDAAVDINSDRQYLIVLQHHNTRVCCVDWETGEFIEGPEMEYNYKISWVAHDVLFYDRKMYRFFYDRETQTISRSEVLSGIQDQYFWKSVDYCVLEEAHFQPQLKEFVFYVHDFSEVVDGCWKEEERYVDAVDFFCNAKYVLLEQIEEEEV